MAYDETLAHRLRSLLAGVAGVSERRMFGGLCLLLSNRMCCGVVGRKLVVRVGPEDYENALRQAHARPMDFTGRPLLGFVYVDPPGYRSQQALARWVRRAVEFVGGLPARPRAKRASQRRSPARLVGKIRAHGSPPDTPRAEKDPGARPPHRRRPGRPR